MSDEEAFRVVRKPSQTDAAVDLIRSKIIDLTLPQGSRIDERLLIDQFKLGRTPAREAINRLQAEGFVNIIPDRGGKYVRDLDMQEIGEILTAHQVAESMLATLCDFDDPGLAEDLTRIQKAYVKAVKDRDFLRITELNHQFHMRMVRSIDNDFLFNFANSIHLHVRRLLVMLYKLESKNRKEQDRHFKENIEEHWAIVKNVETKDRKALLAALPEHAFQTQRRLSRFFEAKAGKGYGVDIRLADQLK